VAVTCAVWIAVLWHWRASQRDVAANDIVLYLAVLPLTAFSLVLAMRWALGRALETQTERTAGASRKAAEATSSFETPAPKPILEWYLHRAWARTAGGHSAEELLAPGPHANLRDDEDLPVMSALIGDLDTQQAAAAMERNLSEAAPRGTGRHAPNPGRALRALASLSPLLAELEQALATWAAQWEVVSSTVDEAQGKVPAPAGGRIIRVVAAWPVDWDDSLCAAAQAWLVERLCAPLERVLPLPCWSVQTRRMSGAELVVEAQTSLGMLHRQNRDDPLVLLACHSDLDTVGIQRLESQARLFHPVRRPKCAIPGEGAAALVLSARDWPTDALGAWRVRFNNPSVDQRPESIDTVSRLAADSVLRQGRHCLEASGLPPNSVGKIASDADRHTARGAEVQAVKQALLPELDGEEDVRMAGTVTGRLEAVGPLITLAMAAVQARESGRPVLGLSLTDPHWHMVAVLCPVTHEQAPANT
jgi:hypothetical protein